MKIWEEKLCFFLTSLLKIAAITLFKLRKIFLFSNSPKQEKHSSTASGWGMRPRSSIKLEWVFIYEFVELLFLLLNIFAVLWIFSGLFIFQCSYFFFHFSNLPHNLKLLLGAWRLRWEHFSPLPRLLDFMKYWFHFIKNARGV